MSVVRIRKSVVPPALAGWICVREPGIPRFWAAVWADLLKARLSESTRRSHLAGIDRLYRAAERQIGRDCLDRILADCDFGALESVLVGFLAQLRNEAVINGVQRSSAWASALEFVTDIVRHGGLSAGSRMDELNDRLLRLRRMYDQLRPNPPKAGPPIRALPPAVVEDLYAIFDPSSLRNPFRSEGLRWRNALTFLLLLRLGLRRSIQNSDGR